MVSRIESVLAGIGVFVRHFGRCSGFLVLVLAAHTHSGPAHAATADRCADRDPTGIYECSYRPQVHDGPRTDVNDLTTYVCYSDTSFTGTAAVGYMQGDLQSISTSMAECSKALARMAS